MVKPFVYEIRYLPGTQKDYLLERVTAAGDRQGLSYEPDDANWMALLSRQSSFRFLGKSGSLSLYLERSRSQDPARRGDKPYWSAYRKAHGIQVKSYLGQDLAIEKLEAAAVHVQARLKEKLGLSEQEPLLTTRFSSEKIKEQEQKRHLLDQLQKKDQLIADLKQELVTRDQLIADLKQELAMRDQMSKKLQASHGSSIKHRKPHVKRS
jgi:hypothetical protein